jgi:hypothetical protein
MSYQCQITVSSPDRRVNHFRPRLVEEPLGHVTLGDRRFLALLISFLVNSFSLSPIGDHLPIPLFSSTALSIPPMVRFEGRRRFNVFGFIRSRLQNHPMSCLFSKSHQDCNVI